MDTNINKKTSNGLMACITFSVIGIGFVCYNLFRAIPAGETRQIAANAINFLMYVLTLNYVLVGYKKPHGNMLRVLLCIFGLFIAVQNEVDVIASGALGAVSNIAATVAALMVVYVAGRLNKIEKNINILEAAGLMLLAEWLLLLMGDDFALGRVIGRCTPMIVLASLGFAYAARYEAHKAAGMEEAV